MTPTPKRKPIPRAKAAAKQTDELVIDVDAVEEEPGKVVALREPAPPMLPATTPTISSVSENLTKAREFMQTVMVRGIDGDYDVIPYCGDKPVLLKPGAEKLARLFNLSHATERTLFERDGDKVIVAYRTVVYDADNRPIGDVEAVADSAEKTFRGQAPLNTVMRRAAKRSYVAAIQQATGISDLFSSANMEAAPPITEDQRALVVALVATALPSQAERYERAATKVTQAQWDTFLGAAVDAVGDVFEWPEPTRARAMRECANGLITADDAAAFVKEAGTWK